MNPKDHPDDLVTLTTAVNEFEAGTLVAVLQEAGIEAFAFGAPNYIYPLVVPPTGVQVQVRCEDLERAQAALKQNVADSVDLDWNEVDVGQPEEDLPIAHPHDPSRHRKPTPLIIQIGFALALTSLAIAVVGVITGLFLRWW